MPRLRLFPFIREKVACPFKEQGILAVEGNVILGAVVLANLKVRPVLSLVQMPPQPWGVSHFGEFLCRAKYISGLWKVAFLQKPSDFHSFPDALLHYFQLVTETDLYRGIDLLAGAPEHFRVRVEGFNRGSNRTPPESSARRTRN